MKSRLITAAVLIAAIVWIIFFAPAVVFTYAVGVILGLAAWEWVGLIPEMKKKSAVPRIVFIVLIEALWIGFYYWSAGFYYLLAINAVLLLAIVPAVLTYPKTIQCWHSAFSVALLGLSFLVTAGVSLVNLKQMPHGSAWLMSVLLLTWMTDTGAYFSGRFCGQRKLIPAVSPNKTWAGFVGGFVFSALIVFGFGLGFAGHIIGLGYWMFIGCVAILGAVLGDLFISLLKRSVHVKDTGNLLPGHGGVLDRIDSLLVSASIVAFFLIFIS